MANDLRGIGLFLVGLSVPTISSMGPQALGAYLVLVALGMLLLTAWEMVTDIKAKASSDRKVLQD